MLSKARFQFLLQLTRKKERVAAGRFLVEGWRWLEEALALPEPPECVLATPDAARTEQEHALLVRARDAAQEFSEITPEQLARLTGNVSAPGVAAVVRWRPPPLESITAEVSLQKTALVVALDAVGDPGNAGTIMRTADWFGATGVVFGAESVEPTNPKVVRSTMGSLFHLPVVDGVALEETLLKLRAAGMVVVGAALEGEELPAFEWPQQCVLVVGNEANGIRADVRALLDRTVRIPAYGRAESLNAAVAAAVLMADWRRAWPQ